MLFLTLLPLLTWVLFYGFIRNSGFGWQFSFLMASVTWGSSVTLLTEVLSLSGNFNSSNLAVGWTILALVAGVLLFRSSSRSRSIAKPITAYTPTEKLIVVAICVILTCTFAIAIASPPNNHDSLTYHMTRIMFWIQQGTVAHFPTNNLAQIVLNPWAEFAIAHFQLLSAGDHFANLVQWFSMAGCIVSTILIAKLLGSTLRGQLMSGLITATIPMAILQSTSTQNDLVVSFWLVCFVAFGLKSSQDKSFIWSIMLSCSLGLAILTKPSAYLYAFPFAIWFLVQEVRLSWRTAALKVVMLMVIVLIINLGHYQRNYSLFHNPVQSGLEPYQIINLTPLVVVSNISKNVFLHLLTPSFRVNDFLKDSLQSFHTKIGVDLNDAGTTWPGTNIESLSRLAPFEDTSGNTGHFFLFLCIFLSLLFYKNLRWLSLYAFLIISGFIFFCIVLRWTPWSSRLHLPLFILFSPVAGVIIASLTQKWISNIIAVFLVIASLPWVFLNLSRPMFSLSLIPQYPPSIFTMPRKALYFNRDPRMSQAVTLAAARISMAKYKNISMITNGNSPVYPLWILTRDNGLKGPNFEYFNVQNISRTISHPEFNADVVVEFSDNGNVILKNPREFESNRL